MGWGNFRNHAVASPQGPTTTLQIKRFALIVFVLTLKMNPGSLDLEETPRTASQHQYLTNGVSDAHKGDLSWVSYPMAMSGQCPSSNLSQCSPELWMTSEEACCFLL